MSQLAWQAQNQSTPSLNSVPQPEPIISSPQNNDHLSNSSHKKVLLVLTILVLALIVGVGSIGFAYYYSQTTFKQLAKKQAENINKLNTVFDSSAKVYQKTLDYFAGPSSASAAASEAARIQAEIIPQLDSGTNLDKEIKSSNEEIKKKSQLYLYFHKDINLLLSSTDSQVNKLDRIFQYFIQADQISKKLSMLNFAAALNFEHPAKDGKLNADISKFEQSVEEYRKIKQEYDGINDSDLPQTIQLLKKETSDIFAADIKTYQDIDNIIHSTNLYVDAVNTDLKGGSKDREFGYTATDQKIAFWSYDPIIQSTQDLGKKWASYAGLMEMAHHSTSPITSSTPEPSSKSQNSNLVTNVKTLSWKAYTSTQYGYSFKYPDNTMEINTVRSNSPANIDIQTRGFKEANAQSNGGYEVGVSVVDKNIWTIDEYIQQMNKSPFTTVVSSEKMTINNYPAVVIVTKPSSKSLNYNSSSTHTTKWYYFYNDKKSVQFVGAGFLNSAGTDNSILDDIISTFKFTD